MRCGCDVGMCCGYEREKVSVIPMVRENCGYESKKSKCDTQSKRELWV